MSDWQCDQIAIIPSPARFRSMKVYAAYPLINAPEPHIILVAGKNLFAEFGDVNGPLAEPLFSGSKNAKKRVWFCRQASENTPEGNVSHKGALFHVLRCKKHLPG